MPLLFLFCCPCLQAQRVFCFSAKVFDFVHILLYLVHDESERESATASCETWAVLTNNFKEAAKIIAALLNSKQKR